MAHLSTRHDSKQVGVLSSELCKRLIGRETPNDCVVQDHGLYRIGNLADVTFLRKLDIAFNPLQNVEGVDQLPKLQHFNCYSCQLEDIEGLRGMKKIETLLLQQNSLSGRLSDCFGQFVKLKELRLDRYKIQKLGSALKNCSSLQVSVCVYIYV